MPVHTDAAQSMLANFHLLWQSDSTLPGESGIEARVVSQETPLLTNSYSAQSASSCCCKTLRQDPKTR